MATSRREPDVYSTSTYGDVTRDYQVGELTNWETATDNNLPSGSSGEVLDCYDDSASYDDNVILADAICDRIIHSAFRIELKGESVRKRYGDLEQ